MRLTMQPKLTLNGKGQSGKEWEMSFLTLRMLMIFYKMLTLIAFQSVR